MIGDSFVSFGGRGRFEVRVTGSVANEQTSVFREHVVSDDQRVAVRRGGDEVDDHATRFSGSGRLR